MDPALAVSALLARYKADVALAVAARVHEMSPAAAARLVETVRDSAEEIERAAALLAGTGEVLDTTA